MRFLVEVGRFIVTALAVALTVVAFMLVVSVVSDNGISPDVVLIFLGAAFVFAIMGGLFFGLPFLYLAKELGWDRDRKKMASLGAAIGAAAGLLVTIPTYGSTAQFSFPAEIFPFWIGTGALAGLVASQVWLTLHQSDRA